jgi:mRNA-degrading endonuclease RelE of RelBE toxin-antitoxin system
MKPYSVDDSALSDIFHRKKIPRPVQKMLRQKIEEIRCLTNPRSSGGKYNNKWGYIVGKYHLVCTIDDINRIVTIKTVGNL